MSNILFLHASNRSSPSNYLTFISWCAVHIRLNFFLPTLSPSLSLFLWSSRSDLFCLAADVAPISCRKSTTPTFDYNHQWSSALPSQLTLRKKTPMDLHRVHGMEIPLIPLNALQMRIKCLFSTKLLVGTFLVPNLLRPQRLVRRRQHCAEQVGLPLFFQQTIQKEHKFQIIIQILFMRFLI